MDCAIRVVKTKALISFAVTAKLICGFVFAYAKSRFSHDAAQISPWNINKPKLVLRIKSRTQSLQWFKTFSFDITQTCPCNDLRYFTAVKMVIFCGKKNVIFFLFLLKTLIVGTR